MALFSSSSESTASPLTRDLGSVSGFVTSLDSTPVDGASIVAYKNMGLTNSAYKNAGYFTSVATESDGSFVPERSPVRCIQDHSYTPNRRYSNYK